MINSLVNFIQADFSTFHIIHQQFEVELLQVAFDCAATDMSVCFFGKSSLNLLGIKSNSIAGAKNRDSKCQDSSCPQQDNSCSCCGIQR